MGKPKKPRKDRMYEWMVKHWDELYPENQRKILDMAERMYTENERVQSMPPAQRRAHYFRKYAGRMARVVLAIAIIALG